MGLAQRGYVVTASDISPAAIDRLKSELSSRALEVKVQVDDFRTLRHVDSVSMGAVLACDNSIPHLLSDAEILEAFRSFYRCLMPGGVAILSVRDYESIERKTPEIRPYGLRYVGGSRFLVVQA